MNATTRQKLLPFALTAAIIVSDQITKAWIIANVEPGRIAFSLFGDFLWIVRQQNLGMAFSLLDNLPLAVRLPVLIMLPLALVVCALVFYFKSGEITYFQRWTLCGIVGGGIGNVIDRIFRAQGVVDFISTKFWGIFGLERWPTYNIADASVIVSVSLFALSTIIIEARRGK
jgi:signal peptidase II